MDCLRLIFKVFRYVGFYESSVPALESLPPVGRNLPKRPLVIGKAHCIFTIGDTRQ
jgi:hypothetical protein